MKIKKVSAIVVEIPLTRNFGGSVYNVTKRVTVITRIETDDGLVSEIYNGDNREKSEAIVGIIEKEIGPIIAGEEVFAVERVWQKMARLAQGLRDRKLVMEAVSCVDTALWDLMGKAAGVNVSKLLGGFRSELPIISIGGYYESGKTLDDVSREMEAYRVAGMSGCKFKVGGLTPEADAERVAAARRGGGEGFTLAVDANQAWSAAEAIRFAKLIEPYGIAWFEEPCHWADDARSMSDVRRHTSIPVTAGQSEITSFGVRRLIAAGAVDVVNLDASECGGPTDWRRAAALCYASGVRMAHHEEPQVAMQLLSSVPHAVCVECFGNPERDPVWHRLIANRPPVKDGIVQVPAGPGFGIQLDWDMVKRYRLN
jgi:L-alanine-DL-glutamate epimerase-like enolase superfamily enzyme